MNNQNLFVETSAVINKNKNNINYHNSILNAKTYNMPHYRTNNLQKISLQHKNDIQYCFPSSAETTNKIHTLTHKNYKPEPTQQEPNLNLNLNLNLNSARNTNTNVKSNIYSNTNSRIK